MTAIKISSSSVRMRISVAAPLAGVAYAMQRGRADLLPPTGKDVQSIWFDFSLRVGSPRDDGSVNLLGEFAQGTPDDRFLYINTGTRAGQVDSCWDRRAKLKLACIPRDMLTKALKHEASVIEAQIPGTGRDGRPICASIPALAIKWRLAGE